MWGGGSCYLGAQGLLLSGSHRIEGIEGSWDDSLDFVFSHTQWFSGHTSGLVLRDQTWVSPMQGKHSNCGV